MVEMDRLLPLLFPDYKDDPELDMDEMSTEKLYKILDNEDQKALLQIPGMVPARHSVTPKTSKIEALARMDSLQVDFLPVNAIDKESETYLQVKIARKEDVSTSLLLEVSRFMTQDVK
jgi:hypothetical protein